jgi:hypothetical protein
VPAEARAREQRRHLGIGLVDAPAAERDQARAQVAARAHGAEPLPAHDPLEALGALARAHARTRRREQQNATARDEQRDRAEQHDHESVHRYTDLTMRQSTTLPITCSAAGHVERDAAGRIVEHATQVVGVDDHHVHPDHRGQRAEDPRRQARLARHRAELAARARSRWRIIDTMLPSTSRTLPPYRCDTRTASARICSSRTE